MSLHRRGLREPGTRGHVEVADVQIHVDVSVCPAPGARALFAHLANQRANLRGASADVHNGARDFVNHPLNQRWFLAGCCTCVCIRVARSQHDLNDKKRLDFKPPPRWNIQLRFDLTKILRHTMAANHDSHYKLLFSHPELIHDLLVEFVSVVRSDTLRLDTLQRVNGSYTSEAGDARYEDMVWKVRLADRWLYVYLLLEFQSRSDDWMALRMHVYVSLLLQDLQRQNQLSPEGKLPPVLPIVLYNGAKAWSAATDLADLLANAPEGLRPLQPARKIPPHSGGRVSARKFGQQNQPGCSVVSPGALVHY